MDRIPEDYSYPDRMARLLQRSGYHILLASLDDIEDPLDLADAELWEPDVIYWADWVFANTN